jgi:hypothetical protein
VVEEKNYPKPPPIVGQALKGLKSAIQEDIHLIKGVDKGKDIYKCYSFIEITCRRR